MIPFKRFTRPAAAGADQSAPARARRFGATALLGAALAVGAAGGSVFGAAAATYALNPPSIQAATNGAQSIAQVGQTSANVAGAVLDAVGPSVVEITSASQVSTRRYQYQQSGTGSGFVVDSSGLILTNYHVVAGASSVTVEFSSGEQRTATVVGSDSANDIALLQVEGMPSNIPAATLGDSDAVEVGETAIAIGSPFGLEQSVTQGIVSAVDRDWIGGSNVFRGLIQTDAPINPGNSGGPLLDASGQVIGVNTLIESPVEGNVGVGFAVPINIVKQQLARLQAGATLQQGYMGVTIAEAADGSQAGVAVSEVVAGSGAAQAGLQAGDIITAVAGQPVTDYESLVDQISGKQPGDQVTVTFERNGQQRQVTVTLQASAA